MIADRIRELRIQKNLSQEELGVLLNTNQVQVWRWETNRTLPNAVTIFKLSEIFGTTTDYILGRSDAPRPLSNLEQRIIDAYRANDLKSFLELAIVRDE